MVTAREPRDVVCSIKRRYGNLDAGIDRWRQDNEFALRLLAGAGSFLLRYEELIAEPQKTLARLCEFLGLKYESQMLNYWKDERDRGSSPAP